MPPSAAGRSSVSVAHTGHIPSAASVDPLTSPRNGLAGRRAGEAGSARGAAPQGPFIRAEAQIVFRFGDKGEGYR